MKNTTLAARLRSAAAAHVMREAHRIARKVCDATEGREPYRDCLAFGLKTAHSHARIRPATMVQQARDWAAAAVSAGARFNVERKAVESLTFSLANDLAGFCIPSKLVGTSKHQTAARIVADRLAAGGRWIAAETEGADVTLGGLTLGTIQDKHARTWFGGISPMRVGVIAVTGQRDRPDGRPCTLGVNVVIEAWLGVERARREAERVVPGLLTTDRWARRVMDQRHAEAVEGRDLDRTIAAHARVETVETAAQMAERIGALLG